MGCGTSRALPVEEVSGRSASSPPSTAKPAAAPVRPDWPGNQDGAAPQGSVLLELGPARRLSSGKTAAGSFSADAIVAAALKQKRKAGVVIFGQSSAQDGPPTKPAQRVAKSPEINALIRQALKDNVFFSELGEAEIMAIVDAMAPRNVSQGEIIIKQGDPGDNFYVIQSGYFEIVVNSVKVVEWGDNSKNKSFGELALLYNLPRAATVRAMSEAKLWYIDRTTFRHLMAEASHAQHARLREALRKGIFEDLAETQLDSIAAAATIVKYNKGDRIIAKGEEGEVFFIIESGSVICKNLPGDQSNNILTAGDYFGERSLLKTQPRCCDVEAMNDVSLIALHKEDFQTYLANVVELFEYNMGMRLLLCMPLIGTLPEDSRNEVFAQLSVASYNAGAVIAAQGKPADSFFIVKDGNIVVRHTSLGTSSSNSGSSGSLSGRAKDVHHSDIAVLDPGHWFPDKEFDAASPLLHSFVARGDCQVFVLDRSSYVRHVASHKAKLIADGRLKISHLGPASGSVQRTAEPSAGAGRDHADGATPRSGAGAHPQPSNAISKPRDARRFSTEHKLGAPTAPADSLMPSTRKPLGIPLSELELKATVGTGTFGRVRLAYHRKTNKTFALKMLQKNQIVRLKQQSNIMNERDILLRMDHPFIIKLYDTYKDRDRLYMLLEIVQGGELFSRLQNSDTPGRIRPEEARFYSSCVLDAFEYLHGFHVIYRDLKPENLLIDGDGYLKLVDFGFAKVVRDKTFTLCGTPEYLAPELVLGRGHDKGVDYWALGILLYEQVAGYSPFADRAHNDQMVICKNILRGNVEFPSHFRDRELQHIILQLLVKDTSKRFGCGKSGAAEIKNHKFFQGVDWTRLRRKEIRAPWKPKLSNHLDTSNFDEYDEDDKIEPYKDDGSRWEASF